MSMEVDSEGYAIFRRDVYEEFLRLSLEPDYANRGSYTASDGTVLNMAAFAHTIKKNIQHLPKKEQQAILTLKKRIYSLSNKITMLKKQYRGEKIGRNAKINLVVENADRLLELAGRMFPDDEILRIANEEWHVPLRGDHIKEFRDRYVEQIAILQQEYLRNFSSVRLSHKRARLEELSWLYYKSKRHLELFYDEKIHKAMQGTLEAMRKEIEGDRLTIEGDIQVQVEHIIETQKREALRRLNIYEIIMARAAAKIGLSGLQLLGDLNQSYYSRFNGFLTKEPERTIDMPYPSEIGYDFDKLTTAKISNEMLLERATSGNPVVINQPPPVTAVPMTVKDQLLAMIRQKQGKVNETRNQGLTTFD